MFVHKNLHTLLLLLLLMVIQPVAAQDMFVSDMEQDCGLTISGKVLDHDTRTPLPGATVFIAQLQRAAIADANGNYHFHHICQGTYTVKVSYIGYTTESFSFKINTSTVRDLPLHTDAAMLRSVEVVSSRIISESKATETLSGRNLEQTRGLSLGESLKKLSGVSSLQTGPAISKPVIHGMYGSRVLILNNGIRHEAQQWGDEHAPEIDPLAATEMTVVKGAAGVRYGSDAIAGTILINPAPLPDSAGINGSIGLIGNTNSRMGTASGMIQGKLQRMPLSWRLHTSIKEAGDSHTPEYYLTNTGMEEQNLAATLSYSKPQYGSEVYYSLFRSKIGILTSAHIGNLTDLMNAIKRGRPEVTDDFSYTINRPYQNVDHHLLKLKNYYSTGDNSKLWLTYAFQQNIREEFDKDKPSGDHSRPELHLKLITHTTELAWEHELDNGLTGSIGLSTLWQRNTYEGRQFVPFYRNFTTGVFIEEKWRKDKLQLEGGVRYDHKSLNISRRDRNNDLDKPSYTFHNLSASAGALYDAGYHLSFGANISYASRAPHANELFSDGIHHGTASYEIGDANLTSEHTINTVATINYHSNLHLNGEISVYYNTIFDYIYLQADTPPVLTISGAYPAYYYRQANARFWGTDISLSYAFNNRLTLDTKASVVRAYNLDADQYLPNIPADRIDNELQYELGNLGQRNQFNKTFVTLGGLIVARQHRSNTETDPYQLPPDGYFLLNAGLGTTMHLGQQPVVISMSTSNLLNKVYRDYQNRMRYFATETGRSFIVRITLPIGFSS